MRHLAAAAGQPWLRQQNFGPLPRDRQHTARRYRGKQTPGNYPQSCPVYQAVEAEGSGYLRLGDQGSVTVRWGVRQVQRSIGEQHLEDIEEQSWRGDRDPSPSPSPGASSPSSSFIRSCGRCRGRPLSRPLSTDALSRDAATRCNASSSSSSSSRLVIKSTITLDLVLLLRARAFHIFQSFHIEENSFSRESNRRFY